MCLLQEVFICSSKVYHTVNPCVLSLELGYFIPSHLGDADNQLCGSVYSNTFQSQWVEGLQTMCDGAEESKKSVLERSLI